MTRSLQAPEGPVAGLRLGVPRGFLTTEWDNTVGTRFGAARKNIARLKTIEREAAKAATAGGKKS